MAVRGSFIRRRPVGLIPSWAVPWAKGYKRIKLFVPTPYLGTITAAQLPKDDISWNLHPEVIDYLKNWDTHPEVPCAQRPVPCTCGQIGEV